MLIFIYIHIYIYIYIYILLTAIGLTPGGSNTVQYTFTHKQYIEQHNETEYNTYITIKYINMQ